MSVKRISQYSKARTGKGCVWLVGAGPGDPDLLTLKALKCIEQADLILFDRLVSDEIRALFPKGTPAIYVGKAKCDHAVPQEQLNQYLVDKARQGLRICRLKGGDPFVFGRGSEELHHLLRHGCQAEVIPGITAASGCSTYAGIPLTHRGMATGCSFITGHLQHGELDIDWEALARLPHTLVFYMGLSALSEISRQLQRHGLSGHTPAALIERGCTPQQRQLSATLAELPTLAEQHEFSSPTLIVIGDVVGLAAELQWYQPRQQMQKLA